VHHHRPEDGEGRDVYWVSRRGPGCVHCDVIKAAGIFLLTFTTFFFSNIFFTTRTVCVTVCVDDRVTRISHARPPFRRAGDTHTHTGQVDRFVNFTKTERHDARYYYIVLIIIIAATRLLSRSPSPSLSVITREPSAF